MGYNGTCEPKHNFDINFKIFIEVHIVQLINLFDKRTENDLNDRKFQIVQKLLKLIQFNLDIFYNIKKCIGGHI
jgi:hypothetical protein